MKIALMVHARRADAVSHARRIARRLLDAGVQVLAESDAAEMVGVPAFSEDEQADVIISLGGDGTFLRGAQYALKWDAALLGVNLGRVGFLAEVEPDSIDDALSAVVSGRYETETRPVLRVQAEGETWYALNDVVISRGGYSRLISIGALVDGDSAGRYVADGVIVATPTGSTGYCLSAGGPVVSPKVDCMIITPICAHTLQHRPCVVHGGADIRLELSPDDEQSAALEVDGQSQLLLNSGSHVHVHRDEKSLRMIRLRERRFFQLVRDKLTEWTR